MPVLTLQKAQAPGAGVAQDHHRRVLLGPALADIGAGRSSHTVARLRRRISFASSMKPALTGALPGSSRACALGRGRDRLRSGAQIAMRGALATPPSPPNGSAMANSRSIEGYRRFRHGWTPARRWAELAEGQRPQGDGDRLLRQPGRSARSSTPAGEMFVVRNVANLVPPFEPTTLSRVSARWNSRSPSSRSRAWVVMGRLFGGLCGSADRPFRRCRPWRGHFIAHWIEMLAEARERSGRPSELAAGLPGDGWRACAFAARTCAPFPGCAEREEAAAEAARRLFRDRRRHPPLLRRGERASAR
jgi:carbonic anhydrase